MAKAGNCGRCGVWRKSLHRDHVIPRAADGLDVPENIQYLCANCHQDKTEEDKLNPAFEKTRAKLRAAKLGHKQSEQQRLRRSESLVQYYSDPSNRQRQSRIQMGHPVTDETREKIRQGRLKYLEQLNFVTYIRIQMNIALLCRGVRIV